MSIVRVIKGIESTEVQVVALEDRPQKRHAQGLRELQNDSSRSNAMSVTYCMIP